MSRPTRNPPAEQALPRFVEFARRMLDPATPEPLRRELEPQLLRLLPVVRAPGAWAAETFEALQPERILRPRLLGLFDLFEVRDRALAALLRDELALRRELHAAA
jgi:hypothetical protein